MLGTCFNDEDKEKNTAAVALGSMTSPKKKQSSANNGKLGGRPPKPCECSATDANTNYRDHEKSCPARSRLQRAEYRRLKKEKKNTETP